LKARQEHPQYAWQQEVLYRKGKVVVGNGPVLRQYLLQLFYDSAMGGHLGMEVTKRRLGGVLYWKG